MSQKKQEEIKYSSSVWYLMACIHKEAFYVEIPLFLGLHLKRKVCPKCKKVVKHSVNLIASTGK